MFEVKMFAVFDNVFVTERFANVAVPEAEIFEVLAFRIFALVEFRFVRVASVENNVVMLAVAAESKVEIYAEVEVEFVVVAFVAKRFVAKIFVNTASIDFTKLE